MHPAGAADRPRRRCRHEAAARTRSRPASSTTFTAFLLAGAWLWGLLGIGEQHQIQIGAVLLGLLAVTLIVPRIGEWVERPLAFMTRRRFGDAGGGFLLGASLGLVFIPCGGPVLAALTSNVARDRVGGWLVVIALAYAIGAALPLLAIAAGSRRVAHELPPARTGGAHRGRRADGRCGGGDLQRLGREPADEGAGVRAVAAGRDRGQRRRRRTSSRR